MQTAGFVLVGGRSARMGRDKALLRVDAHVLVEDVAIRVQEVAGNVTLVGRPESYRDLGFECLPDLRPGLGPLAGIEAALAARQADLNLILACDLAGVKTPWLRQLLRRSDETNAFCVILRDKTGMTHPLCAAYRSGCLPAVQRALDESRLRAQDFVRELRAEFVEIDAPLQNLNTPQDWEAWQEQRTHTAGANGG